MVYDQRNRPICGICVTKAGLFMKTGLGVEMLHVFSTTLYAKRNYRLNIEFLTVLDTQKYIEMAFKLQGTLFTLVNVCVMKKTS